MQDVLDFPMSPLTPAASRSTPRYELPSEGREVFKQPAELTVSDVPTPAPLNIIKAYSKEEDS
jgi:hypothetical protein